MKRESGFTLIELLAAMVAGSFLLISLSWAVSTLARELARGETHSGSTIEAFAPILSDLLAQALAPPADGRGATLEATMLDVTVPPPLVAAEAGPLRLALRVARGVDGDALTLRFAPIEDAHDLPAALGRERRLASGFASIRFEYGDLAPPAGRQLPRTIAIVFTERDGRVRRITAARRTDSDGRCRFDPISMACR